MTQGSRKLEYAARSDAPTLINRTNRIYFSLAGSFKPFPKLTLTYEDEAPQFALLEWKAKLDETLELDGRPVGQAGIAMAQGDRAQASFQYRDGKKCLSATFFQKRRAKAGG